MGDSELKKCLWRYSFPCLMVAMFLISLVAGITLPLHEMRTEERYTGEVILYTPEEHQEFLEVIGKKDVDVVEDGLHISSESPVTVRFEVYVPKGYEFPYGTTAIHTSAVTTMVVFLVVCVPAAGLVAALSWGDALQSRRQDKEG